MSDPTRNKETVVTIQVLGRLRQALVEEGLLTAEQLKAAGMRAGRDNEPLGQVLVNMGFVTVEQLAGFIGEKLHIPCVDIGNYAIDPKVLELIPGEIARRRRILPLFRIEDALTVAMPDPLDVISLDEISRIAGCRVEPVIASAGSIEAAIDQWYGAGEAREKLIGELAGELRETERGGQRQDDRETVEIRLRKEAQEESVIKVVNSLIAQSLVEGASDIHLEPKRDGLLVRFRIDGFLYEKHRLPAGAIAPVASRIKIISGLDIANRRIAQDGRIGLTVRDRSIDIRTSTFPSLHGENVVLRILEKSREIPSLAELGLSERDLHAFQEVLRATKGIILATGPTGSGKTTTIFSAINALNAGDKNIMTVEDPIEYEIEGVVQSQVEPRAGHTFANALRSILRQDPDVIYVGEIRDLETAEIAVRAALTGHLVISTLHTNDAPGGIRRLNDIGIGAGLLEPALNGCLAQRLVRKLCPRCRQEYRPDQGLLKRLGLGPETTLYRGAGCEFCSGIGYRGRIGIFQILVVKKEVRRLIAGEAPLGQIRKVARDQGMKTLFEDGMAKVKKGITTLEEVMRVTLGG